MGKIMIVALDCNLNDCIKRFYFSIFFEFLVASNAMVADDSGVRRSD
jgi:hypothetical protein